MLERPDKAALLDALAKFLMADLHPTVQDKKLAFRVLIAANVAGTLATQVRTEAERDAAERSRLLALGLPGETVHQLNRALVDRLRGGPLPEEELRRVRAHVKQTLVETLSVVNPAFDTSMEIE
jgi:hypothetical protein